MSRLLLLCVLALSAPPTFSQDCTASPTVATTDDQLTQYRFCTSITGNLQLGHQDCSAPCTITDLTPLGGVVAMDGSLTIQCCNNLTDLSVFGSLQMIRGSLVVYYNARLATISGFAALTEIVGSVSVSQNQRLSTISGFSSLNLIGGFLSVERNTVLADMNGFRRLGLIRGQSTLSGHALTVIHNTRLSSLTGLSGLTNISYGTVHIEGNTALCYAGYPLWQVGSYALRPPSSQQEADKGIDWRTRLSGLEPWQYTWGVEGGGYPTLFIRDNAPIESCASALCDATCPPNAGCLGPADPALCGSCDLLGTFDPCETPPPPSNTAVIVGVVVVLLGVVLLVLIGLGVWGCVVCGRRWKEGKKGSFDINLGGSDSTDFSEDSKPKRRGYSSNPASSDLIASYSTNTGGEPTVKTTYSSHAHPAPSSSNTKSHIAAPPSGPSPNGRGRGVAKSADLSIHTTKTPPRSPSRKGGVVSGRGANGLRNQSSSRENLLSPSRENVVEDFSPPSQGSEVTEGRGNEEEDVDDSPVISQRDPPTETGGKNRGSLLSREPSTEDILQKLLKEKAEIPMNFPRQQVKVTKEMGTGDFGKVLQADAKKLIPGQKKTTVVVKQLKGGASAEEKQAFLRPVEAMKILRHPNVLSLMGVVSEGPALQVMLEYCALGNFKTFLVTKRKDALTLKKNGTLLKMVIDMASGLCYLHSMSVAHNDFAVRSCLVTGEGTVKLGDYGITRQTFKEDYYARSPAQKAWPIRWMAPEQVIVEGKTLLDSHPVSMTANIWSFGVSLWEVVSFAQWPYDEMSNEEVIQMVIGTGKCCLEDPLTPTDPIAYLFTICQLCWEEPSLRPTMEELLGMLKDPSLCKKKKRRSSLTRQLHVSTLPSSRSQTLPRPAKQEGTQPSTVPPPAKQGLPRAARSQSSVADGGTLDKNTNSLKPRRPAPVKPPPQPARKAPVRPAPSNTAPPKPQEPARQVPVSAKGVSTTASGGDNNEGQRAGARGQAPGKPLPSRNAAREGEVIANRDAVGDTTSTGLADRSERNGKTTKQDTADAVLDALIVRNETFALSTSTEYLNPDAGNFEDDDDDDDDEIDESMFLGGAEATIPEDNGDDFILEPPNDFSDTSLDAVDDNPPAVVNTSSRKESASLVIQFAPPTATPDDEFAEEEKSDDVFAQDDHHKVQSRVPGGESEAVKEKKKKKKKRDSKDLEDGSKHSKHKKKKRRSSSTKHLLAEEDDASFAEFEFDRGMDRVPVQTSKEKKSASGSAAGATRGSLGDMRGPSRLPAMRGSLGDVHNTSRTHHPPPPPSAAALHTASLDRFEPSYDDFEDEGALPWLDEPAENKELSFEELDAYSQDVTDDQPRVVYKQDIAELIW